MTERSREVDRERGDEERDGRRERWTQRERGTKRFKIFSISSTESSDSQVGEERER